MYISGKELLKQLVVYVGATVFLAFFGMIYECFSHQVYSFYMIYAFLIPLVLGAVPCLWLIWKKQRPRKVSVEFLNCAIGTFSLGCIMKGVLDIYGTTNRLMIVYSVVGVVLLFFSLLLYKTVPSKVHTVDANQ
ncbi:MAG: hypothetical protein IJ744_11360 [Lachnospiraceae bacterium]|nr:hypothetical protein [Lachnospiraceae bacterium]